MRALTQWVGDSTVLRRTMYAVALLASALSAVSSAMESDTDAGRVALVIPVAAILWVTAPRWRPIVLGVSAGVLAAGVPEAIWLWPGVMGLVFLSLAEDHSSVPWIGWAGGLAGSVISVWFYAFSYSAEAAIASFFAVLLGGAAALFLRYSERTTELSEEAESLRGQALWLEQRTSLARELHDVVGHHVTAIVVQAEAGQVGDASTALRTIGDLGRTALGELDALVVHLRDPDAPLVVSAPPRLSDIDELLAAPLRGQGVEVAVRLDPDLGLDEVTVLTVYRIAQEALTNVTRHAQASHAWVEVVRTGHQVRLRVSDDGVGPPTSPGRGAGLVGIEERVAALSGTWSLSERPGGGTMIDVYLPVSAT